MFVSIRRRKWEIVAFGLVLQVAACGSDKKGGVTGPPVEGEVGEEVAEVVVTPAADTLRALGESLALEAVAMAKDGSIIAGEPVFWSSQDSAVVAVDSAGGARAVGNGEALVTATVSGIVGSTRLVVSQRVAEVLVEPSSATLSAVGATQRLTALARDANGHAVEGVKVGWISADTSIVAVDEDGLAVARGAGEALVEAVADEVRGGVKVMVSPKAVEVRFLEQPSKIRAGDRFDPVVRVAIVDAAGNPVEGATDEVTISLSRAAPDSTLRGTLTVRAEGGVATFGDLSVVWADTAGFTLQASVGGLPPAESEQFVVDPGDPARLEFTMGASSRDAGARSSSRWQSAIGGATMSGRPRIGFISRLARIRPARC